MSAQVWGSGSVGTRQKLEYFWRILRDHANVSRTEAELLFADAAEKDAVAPYLGSAAEMQMQIDEIERGLASRDLTESAAAKLGMKMIEAMMELLKSGEPWSFM